MTDTEKEMLNQRALEDIIETARKGDKPRHITSGTFLCAGKMFRVYYQRSYSVHSGGTYVLEFIGEDGSPEPGHFNLEIGLKNAVAGTNGYGWDMDLIRLAGLVSWFCGKGMAEIPEFNNQGERL